MPNRKNVSEVERKIHEIINREQLEDQTVEEILDIISYKIDDNSRIPHLLDQHINDEDNRLRSLKSIHDIKKYISCVHCGSSTLSGYCGIVKCHKCHHEMFIKNKDTLSQCEKCITYELGDCWVHKEGRSIDE